MDTVIDHQPPVAAHDGWRAAADFEALPLRFGAGQSVMCDKLTTLLAFFSHAAIRDPDAFAVNIHRTRRGLPHLLFRARAREQRPVHERDGGLAEGIGNERGKHTGIFVVHTIKGDTIIRMKGCEPDSTPAK